MKLSRHSIELANADIFRLMDPSYHSSSSSEQAKAYIDRRGEMHDPDFHYFPGKADAGGEYQILSSRSQWEEDEDDELEEKNRGHSSIIAESPRGDLAHHNPIICETTLHPPPLDFSSYDDYTDPEDIGSEQGHDNGAEVVESSHHTESYSQTMKKQWLAVSLSGEEEGEQLHKVQENLNISIYPAHHYASLSFAFIHHHRMTVQYFIGPIATYIGDTKNGSID
ncbi:hypothetical protein BT96DRAFT_934242 [Gymnopus androsaceus JB14]|uniref:Uncharacterized protein n=1 Tax=Gymnopus androsaceus JB14 TaxID=1447944 RepID=A0A6A4I6U1_9AGAR|nr:hypothetical protein BT96DRAFT_934242 [Gymnopus androsaceus JB14]